MCLLNERVLEVFTCTIFGFFIIMVETKETLSPMQKCPKETTWGKGQSPVLSCACSGEKGSRDSGP